MCALTLSSQQTKIGDKKIGHSHSDMEHIFENCLKNKHATRPQNLGKCSFDQLQRKPVRY